ncbi:MAG: M20/M25/M40 family metallo-hydrolase [Fimbriimonadaceae bacterium]|nr:M20/M25/M40 family metallo-hydrolase [Fimbriimonadaceae bacterium]
MVLLSGLVAISLLSPAPSDLSDRLRVRGMTDLGAYSLLTELTTKVGGRMSGSANAAKAVAWGQATMTRLGFQNVHLVPCMVPHWVRGDVESCVARTRTGRMDLKVCALGTSPGTPAAGVTAEVVEVRSLDEVVRLGDKLKGKIVFYNRPFRPELIDGQYGDAGDQRFQGPATAAKVGAVATLVRSLTQFVDDYPHTGTTRDPKIPCAALSTLASDRLSAALRKGPVKVTLKLSCKNLPDVPSASVVGEVTGSESPDDVVVMGGHLDSWDLATGAHDDGAGVCQAIEALRVIKACGLKPKRTVRVVLFMDEEIGGRGAEAYFEAAKAGGQRHLAGIESDSGGFNPRSFSTDFADRSKLETWLEDLRPFGIERLEAGGGGADVAPLAKIGATQFGLSPDIQRYFDYHHSAKDTLDKVHPRELEMGALAMAALAWRISEDGLPR